MFHIPNNIKKGEINIIRSDFDSSGSHGSTCRDIHLRHVMKYTQALGEEQKIMLYQVKYLDIIVAEILFLKGIYSKPFHIY